MTSFLHSNSTIPALAAGSPVTSKKYDDTVRQSELNNRSLLQDLTFVGTVIDVNQQLQSYRIRIAGLPDMLAVRLDEFGKSVSSITKSSSLYGVGTRVLAMTTPGLGVNNAIILGSLPDHMGQSTFYGSPELVVSSPVGALKDKVSDEGLQNCAFNNFNGGHPVDAYPGDTTILNRFGCGLFVGALQTSLVSGLNCSVELHYVDDLLRLSSFNFEHNTAGSETLAYADAGDYTEVKRVNGYVLESLGGKDQYESVPKAVSGSREFSDPGEVTGEYKPETDTQQGWFRYTDFAGYLSNVKLSYVTAPLTPSVRSYETKTQDEVGLFREHIDSTGAYSVVSAKSLSFIKDCFIPVPKEHYKPDDIRGDVVEEISVYRSENIPNKADFTVEGAEESSEYGALLYPATASDSASHKTHRSLVNFRERPYDWTLNEIDEVDLAGFRAHIDSSGFIDTANGVSSTRMFAKLPKVGKLKINANEEVKYYASRSMIMMHEDGSIHIQDGYGASISLRAGGIDITCPGDITLRPGKNLVSIAGDSTSIISGVDVELSANVGDVRVQADRNISMLGGNDGKGGILLESKAVAVNLLQEDSEKFKNPTSNQNAYGGIWFKAPGSSVCTVSKEAYIGNQNQNCQVYLDSGKSDIYFTGNGCIFGAKSSVFVTNPDKPEAGTNLIVTESGFGMQTRGGMLLESSFFMASGKDRDIQYIVNGAGSFTKQVIARSFAGLSSEVGKIQSEAMQTYVKAVQEAVSEQSEAVSEYIEGFTSITDSVKTSVVGKSTSSLSNLTFCYPDSELRGISSTTKYVMFQSDWQQQYLDRGAGKPMVLKGVDPKKAFGVTAPGVSNANSYFWPGAEALSSKYGKFEINGRYVDDKLRFKKEGFDKPVAVAASENNFEGNYVIVSVNTLKTKE